MHEAKLLWWKLESNNDECEYWIQIAQCTASANYSMNAKLFHNLIIEIGGSKWIGIVASTCRHKQTVSKGLMIHELLLSNRGFILLRNGFFPHPCHALILVVFMTGCRQQIESSIIVDSLLFRESIWNNTLPNMPTPDTWNYHLLRCANDLQMNIRNNAYSEQLYFRDSPWMRTKCMPLGARMEILHPPNF